MYILHYQHTDIVVMHVAINVVVPPISRPELVISVAW